MTFRATACLLFLTFSSFAQIQVGVKGGLNLSDVVLNNIINPDVEDAYRIKAGLHAGVYASVRGANEFGFAIEALYSNKGVIALNPIHLHYVNIPLLLQYHVNEKFLVEIGPEIGYLVNANSKDGNLNSTWDNKLDIGLDAGFQYNVWRIRAGMRFNAGFTSVIRSAASGVNGEQVRYLNRVLQIFVAIPIGEIMP